MFLGLICLFSIQNHEKLVYILKQIILAKIQLNDFRFYTNYPIIIITYVLICGNISADVCLHASTHDRLIFLIFSRNSGESRDCPTCISRSLNNATSLLISSINWKDKKRMRKFSNLYQLCRNAMFHLKLLLWWRRLQRDA